MLANQNNKEKKTRKSDTKNETKGGLTDTHNKHKCANEP